MALVVDTNSYVDTTYADSYFADRLYATDYTGATTANKEAALIMATQVIDEFEFLGTRTDVSTPQALKFPRSSLPNIDGVTYDTTTVPAEIKKATCEMALVILKKDPTATRSEQQYDEVELPSGLRVDYRAQVPRADLTFVKGYLKPFLRYSWGIAEVAHG